MSISFVLLLFTVIRILEDFASGAHTRWTCCSIASLLAGCRKAANCRY